jgi:serine/threonine protein phosphatase PrpC
MSADTATQTLANGVLSPGLALRQEYTYDERLVALDAWCVAARRSVKQSAHCCGAYDTRTRRALPPGLKRPAPDPCHSAIQGRRPRMEDRWGVSASCPPGADTGLLPGGAATVAGALAGPLVVGVFDGHGGCLVSEHLAAQLPRALCAALQEAGCDVAAQNAALTACFLDADAEIVATDLASTPVARTARHPGPGATAAVVALLPASSSVDGKTHTLLLAVVGDARAAVAGPDGNLLAVTCDQTPSVAEEAARVVAMGGTVTTAHIWGNKPRVAGVLAISRAFGNAGMKPYVTAEPVILRVPIPQGGCTCLLGSDGLFDVLPTEEALATVCRPRERHPAGAVLQRARHLPEAMDNITVLTLKLGPIPPPPGSQPAAAALEMFATPPTQPLGVATQEGGAGVAAAPPLPLPIPEVSTASCSACCSAIGSKRKLDELVGTAVPDPRVVCLVEPAG